MHQMGQWMPLQWCSKPNGLNIQNLIQILKSGLNKKKQEKVLSNLDWSAIYV